MNAVILRVACWIVGHRWHLLFGSIGKAAALSYMHSMAGTDQFCTRCGALWEDAESEHRALFWRGVTPERLNAGR